MTEFDASLYVKKETMLLVAFVAVVAGFLGGIVFSVYWGPAKPVQTSAPAQQPADGTPQNELTAKQAESILALEKEVAANPGNLTAWTQLGNIYFDTNNFAKAIKSYKQALEIKPDNPDVLTDLGVMYRANGEPQKAISAFDQAMRLDPGHQQSRYNKGVVLSFDLHDHDGARQVWEELLRINPAAALPDGTPLRQAMGKN